MSNETQVPRSMRHLNGNLLCVIDTETTGLIANYHDIHQIAIIPLDNNIKPNTNIMPFYMDMKIKFPDRMDKKAIKMSREEFARKQQHAIDPYTCTDIFDSWFEKLGLPLNKKIIPLAQNWPFDREFIINWLGWQAFDLYFSPLYRDTMSFSCSLNDIADFRSEKYPYPKNNLRFLCSRLDVVNHKAHDALQDALATAEVYRRMILNVR